MLPLRQPCAQLPPQRPSARRFFFSRLAGRLFSRFSRRFFFSRLAGRLFSRFSRRFLRSLSRRLFLGSFLGCQDCRLTSRLFLCRLLRRLFSRPSRRLLGGLAGRFLRCPACGLFCSLPRRLFFGGLLRHQDCRLARRFFLCYLPRGLFRGLSSCLLGSGLFGKKCRIRRFRQRYYTRRNRLLGTLRQHYTQRVAFRQHKSLARHRITHVARRAAHHIELAKSRQDKIVCPRFAIGNLDYCLQRRARLPLRNLRPKRQFLD